MNKRRRGALLAAAAFLGTGCAFGSGAAQRRGIAVVAFERIEYLVPNPLGRGWFVTIHRDGRVELRELLRDATGLHERRWQARATADQIREIAGHLIALQRVPEGRTRPGVPGESRVELVVTPGRDTPWRRGKWAGDVLPGFDEPERLLADLARAARDAGPPVFDGPPTTTP